jgi:hypothetical protein
MTMSSTTLAAAAATISAAPVAEEEEYYSSWSLFLVCMLLILSLLTSYYLQIKRIRAVHETLVSIVAGIFVGLIIRLAPGTMIREMLVSLCSLWSRRFRACTCPRNHNSVITHGMWIRVSCGIAAGQNMNMKLTIPARLLNTHFSSISCFRPSS